MAHKEKPERKGSAGRTVWMILLSLLLLFLLVVLLVMGYSLYMLGKMEYTGENEATISPQQLQSYLEQEKQPLPEGVQGENGDRIEWDTVREDALKGQNVIHILLVGLDTRPGQTRGRSDAMLLCSVNLENRKLTVTSFMRDMYVTIPGYVDHKLNSAYAWGGMALLRETFLVNFGVAVDGIFAVDFDSFAKVIDGVGGVNIRLTDREAKYLGVDPGLQLLDGKTALTYARIRSIGNGDFDRTVRQQNVLQSVLERCTQMGVGQLHRLLEQLLPLVTTDLEKGKLLQYLAQVLPILSGCETEKLQLPAQGAYRDAWVSEMWVLLPDLAENRKILTQAIYGE